MTQARTIAIALCMMRPGIKERFAAHLMLTNTDNGDLNLRMVASVSDMIHAAMLAYQHADGSPEDNNEEDQ